MDYLVELAGIDHVGIGTDFTEGQPRKFLDWLLSGRSGEGKSRGMRGEKRVVPVRRAVKRRGF